MNQETGEKYANAIMVILCCNRGSVCHRIVLCVNTGTVLVGNFINFISNLWKKFQKSRRKFLKKLGKALNVKKLRKPLDVKKLGKVLIKS